MIIFENSVPVEIDDNDPRAIAILELRALAFQQAEAQKAEDIRQDRNAELAATDRFVLPDSPVLNKSEFEKYRQDLRDLTKQAGFPNNVIWPIKPAIINR